MQGDAGEFSAIQWLTLAGVHVALPMFNHSDYDLIADWGDRVERVQVKTSICREKSQYNVTLATRGGNQSWNGLVKRLDPERCDSLFVVVADGRRWYMPARELGGHSCIRVGGPRYADFEVERGDPLPARR
jgi:PD-(D/E)XK endonuclease